MQANYDQNPKEWARTTSNIQFWTLQFAEHLQMLAESLEEGGFDFPEPRFLSKAWYELHESSMDGFLDSIPQDDLQILREVKTDVLKLVTSDKWIGTTHPSVIDHMIREIEFVENPSPRRILALWLTDMCGHAAIDAALIDPAHVKLIKEAQTFVESFERIKKRLGQPENLGEIELLSRIIESVNPVIDWLEDEVPSDTDILETTREVLEVQRALTRYHVESLRLYTSGKLLTIMKPMLMMHTIRESYRAEYDLENILKAF